MKNLPDISALQINKAAVLQLAEKALPGLYTSNTDPAYRARMIAVRAYGEYVQNALTGLIETRLGDLYASHEVINEPRDEVPDAARGAWDEALSFQLESELADLRDLIGHDTFEELAGSEVGYHEPGRLNDIAGEIAKCVAPHYVNPTEKQTGKWLSKVGIVSGDLEPLVALAKTTPIPSAQQATEGLGDAPDDDGEETTQEVQHANGTAVAAVAPTAQELSNAIVMWAEASGPNFQDFASKLDVSAASLRNWSIGKVPRSGSIKPAQIAVMIQDCEDCIGKLQQSLAIFRRMPA